MKKLGTEEWIGVAVALFVVLVVFLFGGFFFGFDAPAATVDDSDMIDNGAVVEQEELEMPHDVTDDMVDEDAGRE